MKAKCIIIDLKESSWLNFALEIHPKGKAHAYVIKFPSNDQ